MQDEDSSLRGWAASALGEIGDTRAVEPLIAALQDQVPVVREWAAQALGEIGDARAVEPLIAALQDEDPDVRKIAAGALGQIRDARAVEFLLAALEDKNQEMIAAAHRFFIERGEKGSEAILIEALNNYGFEEMAEAFLNCGNSLLEAAGQEWAVHNGYKIMTTPGGGDRPVWGSSQ
jgi:HEAT repeat protein